MYSYATRGLGFLVRCATISRQLHVGQGRQRSGGSPLFMINHRSSIYVLHMQVHAHEGYIHVYRKVLVGCLSSLTGFCPVSCCYHKPCTHTHMLTHTCMHCHLYAQSCILTSTHTCTIWHMYSNLKPRGS